MSCYDDLDISKHNKDTNQFFLCLVLVPRAKSCRKLRLYGSQSPNYTPYVPYLSDYQPRCPLGPWRLLLTTYGLWLLHLHFKPRLTGTPAHMQDRYTTNIHCFRKRYSHHPDNHVETISIHFRDFPGLVAEIYLPTRVSSLQSPTSHFSRTPSKINKRLIWANQTKVHLPKHHLLSPLGMIHTSRTKYSYVDKR